MNEVTRPGPTGTPRPPAGVAPVGVRSEMASSLRLALVVLAAVATTATGIEVALIWATHQPFTWLLCLYAIEGLADILIGGLAWDRRPANRTGALLCVLGAATLASAAGNVADPVVVAAGSVLAEVLIASLLHLVLAFPSGRLQSRSAVALVVIGYASCLAFEVPQYVFGVGAAAFPGWGIHARPDVVSACHSLQSWVGGVVIVAACAERGRQFCAQRRGLEAKPPQVGVLAYGMATLLFLPFSTHVLEPIWHLSALYLFGLQMLLFAWIPLVYASGLLRGGFARSGTIEQLGALLVSGRADLLHMRNALAMAVGDASLQLIPARPASGQDPAAPPDEARHPGRGSVRVEGTSGLLATVLYDRALIGDPEVVRSASRLVAVALERHHLSLELLASREIIRESRARVVQAADMERRRLAQDLHDVLQSRLILAAMRAGRLAADPGLTPASRRGALQLRQELQDAITDLRQQLQGLMPALLIERGLPAAIAELADRLPVPTSVDVDDAGRAVPAAVATTGYLIVSEAFTNSLKHAEATRLSVRLAVEGASLRLVVADNGVGGARPAGGSGLRGITDRVEALDGTIDVCSPTGGGTTISVALPCG